MKDFRTDGSARQRRKLNAFYEASRELFTEEHSVNKSVRCTPLVRAIVAKKGVTFRKSLSIAEWVPNRGYAEVKIAKVRFRSFFPLFFLILATPCNAIEYVMIL